jgi:hypothetical protein
MIRRPAALAGPLAVACALLVSAPSVPAAPPAPLGSSLFPFPGATLHPASAASAGLALADRWLGDEPFSNPAVPPRFGATLSGTLLHVSRQDLRADNRNYDETPAFFDGAGVALATPARGAFGASVYAFQPVLRRETVAFSRGTGTPDPLNPPATIEATARARELRAGGAVSAAIGPGRVGIAVEWTRRQDEYRTIERSGDPASGDTRLEFAGDAIGFQLGARLDHGDSSVGGFSVGLGLRRLTALAVEGPFSADLLTGSSSGTMRGEREGGWEAGSSARVAVSPSFRALAAAGVRTAQRWEGFDLVAGRAWEWKLAGELHDARDPWTLRFGLGQERQSGALEPRADVLGVGLGWRFTWGSADVGVVHRTLPRASAPNSFEDRVVLSVHAPR